MDSARDAEYRLRLARGFLAEAEEDVRLSRWRSCVDNAQLALENAAKAVIARFGPIPRSHDVGGTTQESGQLGYCAPQGVAATPIRKEGVRVKSPPARSGDA